MTRQFRILFGGIPLGCDNIGDEAILSCGVSFLRECFPDPEIAVCTRDGETTRRLLNVHALPLFGFDRPAAEFVSAVRGYDLYFWGGATGLSDYPANATALLRAARTAGVPAAVWGAGMDTELNPAFFRAGGRRRKLLETATKLSARKIDCVSLYEKLIAQHMRAKIAFELKSAIFTSCRDPESAEELKKCGFTNAIVGADSAILLETAPQDFLQKDKNIRTIGLCISAQKELADKTSLLELLKRLLEEKPTRLVFIPMNPKTDCELMADLRLRLNDPDRILLIRGCSDPRQIQSIASLCDVVVSSRLHLLILAANTGVPVIGISRGSKIDNFLANFGRVPAGGVSDCNFDLLYNQIEELTSDSGNMSFREKAEIVHHDLLERLNAARTEFRRAVLLHCVKDSDK